jgi:hypothetical protein
MRLDASVHKFEQNPDDYVLRVKHDKKGNECIVAEKNSLFTRFKKNVLGFDSYKLPKILEALQQVENINFNTTLHDKLLNKIHTYNSKHQETQEEITGKFNEVFEQESVFPQGRTEEERVIIENDILPFDGICNEDGLVKGEAVKQLRAFEDLSSSFRREPLSNSKFVKAVLPPDLSKVPSCYENQVDIIKNNSEKIGSIIIDPKNKTARFVFEKELREHVIEPPLPKKRKQPPPLPSQNKADATSAQGGQKRPAPPPPPPKKESSQTAAKSNSFQNRAGEYVPPPPPRKMEQPKQPQASQKQRKMPPPLPPQEKKPAPNQASSGPAVNVSNAGSRPVPPQEGVAAKQAEILEKLQAGQERLRKPGDKS